MASQTPNFDLRRPGPDDSVDVVLDIADNMDKIDAALQTLTEAGIAVYVGDTPPGDTSVNVIWIDTSGG